MDIRANLRTIEAELPAGVRLVAVSKFHPKQTLMEAYEAGQRIFGESKVQEMTEKHDALPKDIAWHFIGHLQTNKVKYIAPYVALIHAVDSYRLLVEIDRQGARCGRVIPCLLQLHIASEETKFGFSFEECTAMLERGDWRMLTHVGLCGLMGMASNTDDMEQVHQEFAGLHDYFYQVKERYFSDNMNFCELSMGMSHDYPIAIEEGATLVRVGSKIFGDRVY